MVNWGLPFERSVWRPGGVHRGGNHVGDRMPTWSADNRTVFFFSTRGSDYEIWRVEVDGGDLRRVATVPDDGWCFRSCRRLATASSHHRAPARI